MSLIAEKISKPSSQDTQLIRASQQFQLINGRFVAYSDNQLNYLQKGYDINDIIYSIVTLIMDKCRVAPWNMYKIADESAYKSLKGMLNKKQWSERDYKKACDLQKKSLEVISNPGKWGELLKYANEYETFNDFVANGIGYKLLTGNKYVFANMIKGGLNSGVPNELWLLPSQWTQIKATDTFPTRVSGYNVSVWNQDYNKEEILHEKYFNPNWDINGQQLYGTSPLKAALRLLQRNNSSLTASASAFDNEGVKGVLYMKNQVGQVDGDIVLDEVSKLKGTMTREWSGADNRGRMGLAGYEVGWIPIGLNNEDMQLIESEKWDLRRLCSVYGVPSQLLNDPDNKSYNNAKEGEVALTTRCALPLLTSFRDALNRKGVMWGVPKGAIIDFDMTVFTELQEDVKEMVQWLEKLPFMPPNRKLDLLNLEQIKDPIMDEPWITQGMGQPLSEWQMNDVDNALNNDTGSNNSDISANQ